MKCHRHSSAEAIGVCVHCGRAVCAECAPAPSPQPLACSAFCSDSFSSDRKAILELLGRSSQNARASVVYYFSSAALAAGAAVAAWFWLPMPFLIAISAGSSLTLLVTGIWHARGARKA